jgi:hypothetical protein
VKDALDRLIAHELPYILVGRDDFPEETIFLPGSFNPLHKGHRELVLAAEKVTGREGVLELSIANVDKPSLGIAEVEQRLLQMKGIYSVVLTSAPTFCEKAELFPGAWFALGYDTAIRLVDPDYHPDIFNMLKRFKKLGSRFVVAGRLYEGTFLGLENLPIPSEFNELFISIPEGLFREDVSSTALRG